MTTPDLSNLPDDVREIAKRVVEAESDGGAVYGRLSIGTIWDDASKLAHALIAAHNEIARMRTVLREARPVVANAAADPVASPWQMETRMEILAHIDTAIPASEKEK